MAIRPWYAAGLILAIGFLGRAPSAAAQGIRPVPPHPPHPKATAESIAKGKALFSGTCANCHGIDGSGANGPNIQGAARALGPEGLYSTISVGVMGSGMPSFSGLGADKIWPIIDYVTSLGSHGGEAIACDAANGEKLYASNGCASCHMVNGQGSDRGPDLSSIGALRSDIFLKSELQDPGANLPVGGSSLLERTPYSNYVMYHVVLADGKEVTGIRVNEDSFTLQLQDAQGNLVSVDKMKARKIEVLPGKSFMPSYQGKLSDEQLNDLVAYLSSLEGAQ